MTEQKVVTDFFSQKRQRRIGKSAVDKGNHNEVSGQKETKHHELNSSLPKQTQSRTTRSSKKLYKGSKSDLAKQIHVRNSTEQKLMSKIPDTSVTSESPTIQDYFKSESNKSSKTTKCASSPVLQSPSKRHRYDKIDDEEQHKRVRVTPKKNDKSFSSSESSCKRHSQKKLDMTHESNSVKESLCTMLESEAGRHTTRDSDEEIVKLDVENGQPDTHSMKGDIAKSDGIMHEITKANASLELSLGSIPKADTNISTLQKIKTLKCAERLLDNKQAISTQLNTSLKGHKNLKDLQATLLRMKELKNAGKNQVPAVEKPNAQKEQKKRVFAHEKFHSLIEDIPRGLSLPVKYVVLQDMFRSMDTVVSLLFNRREKITWQKLEKSVKEMIKRDFSYMELGQIRHVYPEAYKYQLEKGISYKNDRIKRDELQLTLEPQFDDQELLGEERKMTSSVLVARRQHLHMKLISIMKQHHMEFLASLNANVNVDPDKIRRWHPQFLPDRVPDLPSADVPRPDAHDQSCMSAKQVLDKAKHRLTKKAADALRRVAEKCNVTPEKKERKISDGNNNKNRAEAKLSGISESLLKKVRAKEASNQLRKMVRSDEHEIKLDRLLKLPELARSLRTLFVTENKSSLLLEQVCNKLAKSSDHVLTSASAEDLVRLLVEQAPNWLQLRSLGKREYLKMNKDTLLSDVVASLESASKTFQKSV